MSFVHKLSTYELSSFLTDSTLSEREILGALNLYALAMDLMVDRLAASANARTLTESEKGAYNLIATSVANVEHAAKIGLGLTVTKDDAPALAELNEFLHNFHERVDPSDDK